MSLVNTDLNTYDVLYIMDKPQPSGVYKVFIDSIEENPNVMDVFINTYFSRESPKL